MLLISNRIFKVCLALSAKKGFAAYILNEYLRNESVDTSDYYDNIIKILSDAISNAPKFNKDIYSINDELNKLLKKG